MGVAYDSSYWTIVGGEQNARSVIYTTTDPTGTWTSRSEPFGSDGRPNKIGHGSDGYFVIVCRHGEGGTATDPTAGFTARNLDFSTGNIWRVDYGDGYWVAVGEAGKIRVATDPTSTWAAPSSSPFDSTYFLNALCFDDGVWVVVATKSGVMKIATTKTPTGT